MKLFTPTLAAAAALAAVARADSCDTTKLATIIASSNVATCTSDSGYDAVSLVAPTGTELPLMCSSSACRAVLSSLVSSFPNECTVSTFSLYGDLITPVEKYCSAASAFASNPASASASADSTTASEASASASASDAGDDATSAASGSAIDKSAEVTVAPTTNSTSSTSSDDDDAVVGDGDSGSDYTIETSAPTTDSSSGEAQDKDASASSTSSAASEEASASGSSAGVVVGLSRVLLGSALAATAALFL